MTHLAPTLSLIIPTRQRTVPLRRLLDSLTATAAHPQGLEVVLVVDADDQPSIAFEHPSLSLTRVVVPPGQTMGALNTAGYRASTGEYMMLLNDDVVARTPGWDDSVLARLRRFPDGIVLVHVNDLLLRDNLCVFPLVSRIFCELAGGICPRDYLRYRIDDHIEDHFNLLAFLGYRRTIYLPDVIFEHCNAVAGPAGLPEYHSLPEILALDAPRFLSLFPSRKEIALRLANHIETAAGRRLPAECRRQLEALEDPFALRVPGRLVIESDLGPGQRLFRLVGSTWRRGWRCWRSRGFRGLSQAVRRRLGNAP
jgi:hypothetical protein